MYVEKIMMHLNNYTYLLLKVIKLTINKLWTNFVPKVHGWGRAYRWCKNNLIKNYMYVKLLKSYCDIINNHTGLFAFSTL